MDRGAWWATVLGGAGSLVGCRLWGHKESDTTEATAAAAATTSFFKNEEILTEVI